MDNRAKFYCCRIDKCSGTGRKTSVSCNLIEQNGQLSKHNNECSDYRPRVLPFNRISPMWIVCEKQLLSKKKDLL